jgi:hypothetical protein
MLTLPLLHRHAAQEIFNVIPPSPEAKRVEFSAAGSPISNPPTLYTMPSVREQHELHFTFALPSLFDAYATKPDELLSHLVSSGKLVEGEDAWSGSHGGVASPCLTTPSPPRLTTAHAGSQ